jgi:hypothetical protein
MLALVIAREYSLWQVCSFSALWTNFLRYLEDREEGGGGGGEEGKGGLKGI